MPKDADGKTLLHYAIQVYRSDQARFVRMLLTLLPLACCGRVFSQTAESPEKEFDKFIGSSKAAVARADAKTVADLTKLPFLFDGKPRGRAGFQKIYAQLFDARVRACFAATKVIKEQELYTIHCGRYIFYFGRVKGQYRLLEFAADPEAAN